MPPSRSARLKKLLFVLAVTVGRLVMSDRQETKAIPRERRRFFRFSGAGMPSLSVEDLELVTWVELQFPAVKHDHVAIGDLPGLVTIAGPGGAGHRLDVVNSALLRGFTATVETDPLADVMADLGNVHGLTVTCGDAGVDRQNPAGIIRSTGSATLGRLSVQLIEIGSSRTRR